MSLPGIVLKDTLAEIYPFQRRKGKCLNDLKIGTKDVFLFSHYRCVECGAVLGRLLSITPVQEPGPDSHHDSRGNTLGEQTATNGRINI